MWLQLAVITIQSSPCQLAATVGKAMTCQLHYPLEICDPQVEKDSDHPATYVASGNRTKELGTM